MYDQRDAQVLAAVATHQNMIFLDIDRELDSRLFVESLAESLVESGPRMSDDYRYLIA